MVDILSYVFVILGVLAFGFGYRKLDRNWMLVGAIFLTLSGGISEFAIGWQSAM